MFVGEFEGAPCLRLFTNHLWDNNGKGYTMHNDSFDLEIALRRLQQHANEEGDLGYAYWSKVRDLLIDAESMKSEIARLKRELEACRSGKD